MALNPVERQLVKLASRWELFRSDGSKRLLVWQTNDNALRFFHCFFEVQKHETEYTVGDLFVVFDTPFENSVQYSRGLKEALVGQYEASRESLEAQGITPDWSLDLSKVPDSAAGFVNSLRSFGSNYFERIGHLVAVFMPSEVSDSEAFSAWLSRALTSGVPERLRFVVTDSLDSPRLGPLLSAEDARVAVDQPDIDALTTAQETFAQEATVGPAGVFRNHLIGLMSLVEKGNTHQVKIKAVDALNFARAQGWTDQEVVVRMLAAGALLKDQDYKEAVRHYAAARKTAQEAVEEEHPSGKELVLQTWFGEAGVQLAAGDFDEALACYDQAAAVAQEIPNAILSIEAFRMGAFCAARLAQTEEAVDRGHAALDLGARLKPDARPMTTLPIAAIDLLRVLEPDRVTQMAGIKDRRDRLTSDTRRKSEQQASELESSGDPQALRKVETNLRAALERIELDASRDLDTVEVAGNEVFRRVFGIARGLLGETWPLANLIPEPQTQGEEGTQA